MDKNLRCSGIESIEDISWGTHIGQLYTSIEDFNNVVAPYICTGLKNNEMCLWIYAQNISYDEIKYIISKQVDDVDSYIRSGQLILLPFTELYFKDNIFNEVRANSQWIHYAEKALNDGYDGLRAAADTYWLEKSYYRSFEIYEENINKLIPVLNFIVLCLYDVNKTDTLQVAEIIKNHSYVMIKNDDKFEVIKNVELLIKDKQLKQAYDYDRLKTQFFANISHELRTPLNVILGIVQMLELKKQSSEDVKEQKYLKILKQNSFRLVRLINNIIDITKIDADYYDLKMQNYDIVNLVEEITISVAEYALNNEIAIAFDTDVEEKVMACDPDQIERIILNLLSNAIKFTSKGGEILVSMHDCGENIEIIVKDNGIGIPKDKQEIIFNRFEQVDKTLTRQNEGSGIGLSLVKSLVEKHDGEISLFSEVGKGSEFKIDLPCKLIENHEIKSFIYENSLDRNRVEKISVEFSDIYS